MSKNGYLRKFTAVGVAAVGLALTSTAHSVEILCQDENVNHMLIDDSTVSACLDAGEGNLTGNSMNDLFLNGVGGDYELASKTDGDNPYNLAFTQDDGTGTWSFDDLFWGDYSDGALGFKFGTGNQPDEWFVYSLVEDVSDGNWEFVNVYNRGGGLSHVNLYGVPGDGVAVPEPTSIALLGLGLLGVGLARRRGARG